MRVAIATRIFDPEPSAASFRLRALSTELSRRGHEVTVLTTRYRATPTRTGDNRARVRRWPVIRNREGQVRGYVPYLSFDLPLVLRMLFSKRFDAVVIEPPPTTGIAVLCGTVFRKTRLFYYAADIWSDGAEGMGSPAFVVRILRRLERWVFRRSAGVLAVNEGVANRIREIYPGSRVTVVGNGVDTGVFRFEETSEQGMTAIYAGTTSHWQGAGIFIRAFARVRADFPAAKLLYLGQGSEWDRLKDLANEVGPQGIRFVDQVAERDAAALLRTARVSLVSLDPASGYDFAIPTKIFAAVASGVEVLFAGEGASATLIREHSLGLTAEYEIDQVADRLREAFGSTMPRERRKHLADWAEANGSLAAVASRAVDCLDSATAPEAPDDRRPLPDK